MKNLYKISHFFAIVLLLLITINAQQPVENKTTTLVKKNAEQQKQAASKERRGSISGRIVSDNGQPMTNISVNVFQQGTRNSNGPTLSVDEDGRFQADDLPAGVYSVNAYVPGYVPTNLAQQYYRLGDNVTLTMVKGGVITGTVKDAAGEPIIGVPVIAIRVRDADGKPLRVGGSARTRQTDDRGIYRCYGLLAGTYIVAVGGRGTSMGLSSKYGEDMPTYYPSATRDTAAEIPLQTGQEMAGIDITYRGEKGHAVSGTVGGALPTVTNYSIGLSLINAATGAPEASTGINSFEGKRTFAFYGVPDGDYFIRATSNVYNEPKQGGTSIPKRISVRGDVTGLEVNLVPYASISGTVVLESLSEAEKKKCQPNRDAVPEETVLFLHPDAKGEAKEQQWFASSSFSAVQEKGEFIFYGLRDGRYRINPNLPSDNWYLKEILTQSAAGAKQPKPASLQLNDAATKGITLKSSENLEGLKIVLAEGAATLSGRVTAEKEGEALPAKLLIHVVPIEKERANEVLRYAQVAVKNDGSFTLAHLAPGKYWLLARPAEESNDAMPHQAAWNATERTALRKEAEAANITIELQTCQRLSDYVVHYKATETKK
jgi:hypothetical protein